MGLFDFLFGSKRSSPTKMPQDRIWISHQAKLNGIGRELTERRTSDSAAIFLIAHFPETLEQLERIAAKSSGPVPVRPMLASELSTGLGDGLHLDERTRIELIVAERHPLVTVDRELLQLVQNLPCQSRVGHHLSLDDRVLKDFVGPWVEEMLQKLGMTEDEPIESTMVSRRISAAQEQIEERALGNTPARSADEWMEKNLPAE